MNLYETILYQVDEVLLAVERITTTVSMNYFQNSIVNLLKFILELPFL